MKWKYLPLLAALSMLPVQAAAAQVDSGSKYCFSSRDFGSALTGAVLRRVPEQGDLLLGSRKIRAGDVLTAGQLSQLVFVPRSTEADEQALVCFLPVDARGAGEESALTLSIRGKENKPPVAEDSAVETYKNMPVTGRLKVEDPEEEAIQYAVTRMPRRGDVTIGEDGSFTYTPENNKVGVDSFAYTATDAAGKVSREATVTITILRPTEPVPYADTARTEDAFYAEWLRSTGIFAGEVLAGESCFQPEKTVSKGEFLTMVVKTLSIPVEQQVPADVGTNLPQWLRPYATAALRAGLTADSSWQGQWDAGQAVTSREAAGLLCAAMNLDPRDGEDAVQTLSPMGVNLEAGKEITRAQAARAMYRLAQSQKK